MAVPQASLPLTFRDVFELYRDVGRFALRPTMAIATLPLGAVFGIILGALFALDCSLALGVYYLETGVEQSGYDFPDAIQEDFSFEADFLSMVILAPILEEAFFRGWLNGQLAALRFAGIAWIAVGLMIIAEVLGWALLSSVTGIALILILIGFVQWLATRKTETHVPDWFKKHYGKLVWGSTIAFGLVHIPNYESFGSPLDLMLVASQTIGGLVLAYTRTRLGLGAAIVQHAAFNLMVLTEATAYG
ncbi:MAG: CPBP family glutamic-type intramembrane protease [Pseudomonadota bacterium]